MTSRSNQPSDDGHSDGHPQAIVAELRARQQRFEQIQQQSHEQLAELRNDPEVRRVLADYARDFGEGDPAWWKPEFELADASESERIEHIVAAVPQSVRTLGDSIAKVVIRQTPEQLERLSDETGITLDDLRSLQGDPSDLRRSHTALRLTRHVQAIGRAAAAYGLDPTEFEKLPEGPSDRTAGTIVGRKERPAAPKYEVAPRGVTGTAKLAVPDAVQPASEPAALPLRRRSVLWYLLPAVAVAFVVTLVLAFDDEPAIEPAASARPPSLPTSVSVRAPASAPASLTSAEAPPTTTMPHPTAPPLRPPAPAAPTPPSTSSAPSPPEPPSPPTAPEPSPPPQPTGSDLPSFPEQH